MSRLDGLTPNKNFQVGKGGLPPLFLVFELVISPRGAGASHPSQPENTPWCVYVLAGLGISNFTPFSAEAFPVSIANAEVIAFSPPQRMGLPVRIAEQNSAISFSYEMPLFGILSPVFTVLPAASGAR